MPRCSARKPDGTPCERIVGASQTLCYSHDPERQAERQRNAARGGRGKASGEVRALKGEIRGVIADVRRGALDRNDASTLIAGYRALKDYIELERRIAEQDELLERLQALEEAHAGRARSWG